MLVAERLRQKDIAGRARKALAALMVLGERMIYRARRVLPMDGRVIDNGEVLVSDGEIRAVGEGLSASNPDEPVRDLGECALLPGFVNTHSHIEHTLSRNKVDGLNLWDWLAAVGYNRHCQPDQATLIDGSLLGLNELLASGVTCTADSSFSGVVAAEAMSQVGLRGIAYREIFGQSMGDTYPEHFARALDEICELQSKCSPLVRVGLSPHAIYTSNSGLLELCADACAESGIPIAVHLAETAAEVDYSLYGTGPIADWRRRIGYEPMVTGTTPARYLRDMGLLRAGVCLAHCVHLDEEEIEMVAASGAGVAHCPRSNAYLGAGVAPIVQLMKAGAKLGLGTDGAGSCMRLDFFEEMRFALGIHRAFAEDASVLAAKQVIEAATIGGARSLGLDGLIGTIEPGKRADLIAINLADVSSDEDIYLAILARTPADVVLTMVDGAELGRAAI